MHKAAGTGDVFRSFWQACLWRRKILPVPADSYKGEEYASVIYSFTSSIKKFCFAIP